MQQGGRLGGHVPPHFLTDQLTLSQPGGGAHYPHPVLCAPRIFDPCCMPGKEIDEISTGIKAGSKVSATTETGTTSKAIIETLLGAKFSTEVGQS